MVGKAKAQVAVFKTRGALPHAPAIILDALVARGASVNSSSARDGQTALHLAARHGRTESAAQLVAHGADLSLENDVGLTPGRLAAKSGFPQLAELLETAPELEAVPEEMPEPLTSPQGPPPRRSPQSRR